MSNEEALITQAKASFIDQPFRLESFEFEPWEFPFTEVLGARGKVITFQSQFASNYPLDIHLAEEIDLLIKLELSDCYYGAAACPVFSFICEYLNENEPLTGTNILAALKPQNFRSEHIENLDATAISFPGYHPGTDNDEIHTDFSKQNIFEHEDNRDEFTGTHGAIKRSVVNGKMWYVLLHTTPEQYEEYWFSRYVILFAVGLSLQRNRLLGVVTHQVCHNLCD